MTHFKGGQVQLYSAIHYQYFLKWLIGPCQISGSLMLKTLWMVHLILENITCFPFYIY